MKKLLLGAMVIATALLVYAFIAPAMAANTIQRLTPVVQVIRSQLGGLGTVLTVNFAAHGHGAGATIQSTGTDSLNGASTGSSNTQLESGAGSAFGPPTNEQTLQHGSHTVATSGKLNCGRFGNGFHGGKHDDSCPNKPFPVGHSGTVS